MQPQNRMPSSMYRFSKVVTKKMPASILATDPDNNKADHRYTRPEYPHLSFHAFPSLRIGHILYGMSIGQREH